jgi:hypothetical protein
MAGTVVKIKQSSVAGKLPSASDLQQGELAINTADVVLYSKNGAGEIITLASGAAAAAKSTIDMGDVGYDIWIDGGASDATPFVTQGTYDGGDA